MLVASNISERENEYNRQKAKEEGIPDDVFRVDHYDYDAMPYTKCSFDLIFANDCLLHSVDKVKLMQRISQMLTDDGVFVFTDIIQSPDADRAELEPVCARAHIPFLGDQVTYHRTFTQNGLAKILSDCSTTPILRHYGAIKYSALNKKDLLLKEGVSEEFVNKQISGLAHWIDQGKKGNLLQGWFVYKKKTREQSFIMIKPDGVQRGLVGKIMQRFETKGFKLAGMKLCMPGKGMFEKHYADLSTKPFFGGLVEYAASGPVCCMVWEGKDVILTGRKMLGTTKPFDSEPGTIRGDFCIDVGRNVIHGSDSIESAKKEIDLWFKPEELVYWGDHSETWVYE